MHALPIAVLAVPVSILTTAFPPASAETDSIEETLEWFETLGFPDTTGLPYVRVATGFPMKRGVGPWQNQFIEGFLVREEGDAFSVFVCGPPPTEPVAHDTLPLNTVADFVRKPSPEPHKTVNFEILDFARAAAAAAQRFKDSDLRFLDPPGPRSRMFTLARACRQNGLDEDAAALFEMAAAEPDWRTGSPPESLRDALQQEMGAAEMRRIFQRFTQPEASWADLAANFERLSRNHPAFERAGEAAESAALLRQMAAEEDAHAASRPGDDADEIEELIFQLRNVRAWAWAMPGGSVVALDTENGAAAANRLAAIGLPAVPRLIAALDDRRFTRSHASTSRRQGEFTVFRVADCAERILEHIAGRHFLVPPEIQGMDVRKAAKHKAIEEWWGDVQRRGEEQSLIDAVAAGESWSHLPAQKLVRDHPASALDAIAAGIRAAQHPGFQRQLVEVAARLDGPEIDAFLESELRGSHALPPRTAAAAALIARDRTEAAIPPMIQAWDDLQPALVANEPPPPEDMSAITAYDEAGPLIALLARLGDAGAIDALARHFPSSDANVKLAIVQALAPKPSSRGMSATGRAIHIDLEIPLMQNESADAAAERLLLDALSVTDRRADMQLQWGEASMPDPRICDMAAIALSTRWPKKYPLVWTDDKTARSEQIAAWRSPTGQRDTPEAETRSR